MTNAYANEVSTQEGASNINSCQVRYDLEIELKDENGAQSSDQNDEITYTLTRKYELPVNAERLAAE